MASRTSHRIRPEGRGSNPFGLLAQWTDRELVTSVLRQWPTCGTASLTMLMVGTIYGWTTTSLLPLTTASGDVPLIIRQDEYSWIDALTVSCSVVGSLLGVQLADRKGRRYSLRVCSAIFTVGWIIIYATTSVRGLYLARVIHGIGIGIAQVVNPMYMSEIVSTKFRGSASAAITVNVYSGLLLTSTLELWLTYEKRLVFLAILSFMIFISNMFLPETPYFLMVKGREEQAYQSIKRMKGSVDEEELKMELHRLRKETKYELRPQSRYELRPIYSPDLSSEARSEIFLRARTHLPPSAKPDLPPRARADLPSQARPDLPPRPRADKPSPARADLPSQARPDLPPRPRADKPSPARADLPSQARPDLPPRPRADKPSPARADLPSQARPDLPPQARADLPSRAKTDLPSQPRTDLPSQARTDLPSQARPDLPPQARADLSSRAKTDLPLQARTDLPSQARTDLPSRARTDLPSQSGTDLPSSSKSSISLSSVINFALQSGSELSSQSRSDLPSTSKSNLPPQSITEGLSDPIHEADTEPIHEADNYVMSNLYLASSSDSPSTSVIHLEVVCDVHQKPTVELHLQGSRDSSKLPLRPFRALRSQSASELYRPSSSEIQRPSKSEIRRRSTSEIRRRSTSELHQPHKSEIHRLSASEIRRPSTREVQQPSTRELPLQPLRALHSQSASELHRLSTSEIQRPSTSEIQLPSTSGIQRPSTSGIQRQSTSEIHRPSTSGIQRPSTSGIQRPSTSGIQRPSTSGIQRPSASEMNRDLIREIQPIADSPTQFHVDLRAATDTDEICLDGIKRTWLTKLRVILQPSNGLALYIILGLILARQLSGNYVTIQYLKVLLGKTGIVIHLYHAMMYVNLINYACGGFTITMVDYLGRKVLWYLSTLGSSLSLIILAFYLLFIDLKIEVIKYDIIPIIDLIAYQIAFQIGLATLPNVFLCDLFPTEQRGFVGAIIVIFDAIIGFLVSKLYEAMIDHGVWYVVYFMSATSCFFAFLMVLIHVPETKGKTYNQIKELLATNRC